MSLYVISELRDGGTAEPCRKNQVNEWKGSKGNKPMAKLGIYPCRDRVTILV
jgi:hypothetical protein